MRIHYRKQLETLHLQLIEMGAAAVDAIETAMRAVFDHDLALAKKTSTLESSMDEAEREIQSLCLKLLLGQQPVASDLRQVSATMHMISDLERVGDLAEDIAEVAPYIEGDELLEQVNLKAMSDAACGMVSDSLNAYVKQDVRLAHDVIQRDDKVDEELTFAKKKWVELVYNGDEEKVKKSAEEFADILMISKYLERVADHAVNVAEWVIYAVDGILPGDETEYEKDSKNKEE
ncbi:MAG: phosphate signaling complex protein PhoU [Eubacterium sp.]